MAQVMHTADDLRLLAVLRMKGKSLRVAGREIGVSASSLGQFIRGQDPPGRVILDWLGFEHAPARYVQKPDLPIPAYLGESPPPAV